MRRRAVALIYVLTMIAYLAWRVTIINSNSLGLSVTYFAAEVLGFVLGLTIIFCSWTYRHRAVRPPPAGFLVDVLVPTYREPLATIRRTLEAAKAMRYPHTLWVLDDGRRREVETLAAEFGIRYLSRPVNTKAKAGNLNHALARSSAEFVAVFDADHAPKPDALDVLLSPMSDPDVAMVQAPQDYFNTDAFPYMNARATGELWHDQSFFYNIAQPCRDAFNGASCAGTSVVYRRSALDRIGGIPEETVTEDLHTSLRLHKDGQKVVYVNEPVAYGIAAVDLAEYYKTRHRWAHGNLHALRLENAAFTPRLTLAQKLSYLSLGLIYLEGWQQLLLFLIPVASLMLGLQPFEISVFNVLVVLSFPLLTLMLLQELGCGFTRHWTNEVFAMARFPVHIAASIALVRGRMIWRSSSKALKGELNWLLLAPQLCVAAASVTALVVGIVQLAQHDFATGPLLAAFAAAAHGLPALIGWSAPDDGAPAIDLFAVMPDGYTLDLVIVAGAWALFNCARAAAVVMKAIASARATHEDFRFEVPLVLTWRDGPRNVVARVVRTSETTVELEVAGSLALEPMRRLSAMLCLPDRNLDVDLDIVRVRRDDVGLCHVEARYDWASPDHRRLLERCLYAVDWHREIRGRSAYFRTPLDAITGALSRRSAGQARGAWTPALSIVTAAGGPPGPHLSLMRQSPDCSTRTELIHFSGLPEETLFTLIAPCAPTATRARVVTEIHSSERRDSHMHVDGSAVRRYAIELNAVATCDVESGWPLDQSDLRMSHLLRA